MPGLGGIIDFRRIKEKAAISKDMERMSEILSHTSACSQEVACFDGGAISAVQLKVHPSHGLLAEDQERVLSFWGSLWDELELKRESGQNFRSIKDINVGQLLLEILNKKGIEAICKLNGRFVVAIWDKVRRRLYLINDRYGFAKLYYWARPDRIVFSSEYKSITWHQNFSRQIDKQGLADFFTLGYCTEDRTLFKNIRLLPQGSVVTFEENMLPVVKKYWDYSFYDESDPLWTEDDYIDQFFDKLKLATKRQTRYAKELAVPLSGGFDSRALTAMLDKINYPGAVKTFSYGNRYALDVIYGRKIAKNLRYDHTYIPIESDYLKDYAEKFVWLMEGSVNCLNAHMLLTHSLIVKNHFTAVVTGFLGDIICGSADWIYGVGVHGGTDDEDIFRQQYAVHANIMNDKDQEAYLKKDFFRKVRGKTFDTLRSRYFKCPSKCSYFRSRYFSTHERQRRYTSFNVDIFDSVANVIAPFLDVDFVEFAYHIPPPLAVYQNCYRKMIIKHLPKVASVPHNETRLPLNASSLRKGLHWRWERLNRNPLVKATIGRRYAKMNDNYINSSEAIRRGSRDFVVHHVKNSSCLSEYFRMDRINQMLDGHISGKMYEPAKITALLTFSIWHNLFVEGKGDKDAVQV